MATESEILQLIVKAQGADDIRRITDELKEEQKWVEALISSHGSLDAARVADKVAVDQILGRMVNLNMQLEAAQKSTRDYGQGLMQASFALQDFLSAQGDVLQGLYRIQNNIPVLLARFGLGAGLAGTISLVSLAIGELLPLLIRGADQLGLFGDATTAATDRLEALKKTIADLEKKPVKLAVDHLELEAARKEVERINEALKVAEQLSRSRAHFEEESGRTIREAFAEAPGGAAAVQGRLRAGIVREQIAAAPAVRDFDRLMAENEAELARQEQRAREAWGTEVGVEAAAMVDALKEYRKTLEKARSDAISAITRDQGSADRALNELLRGAIEGGGPEQISRQAELERRLGQAGMGGLARGVRAAAPENLRALESQEDTFQAEIDARRKQIQDRDRRVKKEADSADRLDEQLNRQGEQQERMGREREERANKQVSDSERRFESRDSAARTRYERAQQDAISRQLQQSGVGLQAQQYAAQLRAAGATPEQEQAQLRAGFAEQLARQRPDLNILQRSQLSSRLARETTSQLDQRLLGIGQQGLNAQQALLSVSATLNSQVAQLAAQQNMLWRQAQDLQRRVQSRSRPANMGRNGGL